MTVTQETIDKNFALIEAAALAGERCPQSKPYGPLDGTAPAKLARLGRIRVEIFMHNYRVVTIMEGPNAGKHTARPAPVNGRHLKPYKTIYKDEVSLHQASRRSAAPVSLAPIKMREIPE